MKRLLFVICVFTAFNCFSQEKFQLAPPFLNYSSVFFAGSGSFSVVFNQPGVHVYYTLNDKEPTEKDAVYTQPVTVTKKTIVKVKAIGDGYLPSETVRTEFIKASEPARSITYTKPNESHANVSPEVLNDNIGGILNNRSTTWLAYDCDTAQIDLDLGKRKKISSVLVEYLQDENSWIFLPQRIELYYFNYSLNQYVLLAQQDNAIDKSSPQQCVLQAIKPSKKIKTDKLKLILLPVRKIPEWHPGKGYHGWLFIDEIKVY